MDTTERAFLQKLAQSGADDLIQAVRAADEKQERVLRIYLGDAQFEEISRLAAATTATRGAAEKLGNVVVLHGIMGGELSLFDQGKASLIWVQILNLLAGKFADLGLDANGLSVRDVRATGIYLRYYGSQIVQLNQDWNVRPFCFDWRQDIRLAAEALFQNINSWFGSDAPVHLVAHSMGGLVARSYIQRHPDRWNKADSAGNRSRLVMLGTPNQGSFAIPRMFLGTNDVLNLISKVDLAHTRNDLLNVAKTFVGAYQMLPVRGMLDGLDILYKSPTYNVVPIDQALLDQAEVFQAEIAPVVDPQRMVYVAGYNRPTPAAIQDATALASDSGYYFSRKGDGTVPHDLGLLPNVKTFYIDEEHQNLPSNKNVQSAMTELLQTGDQKAEQYLYKGLGPEFAAERGTPIIENQALLLASESKRKAAKENQVIQLRTLLSSRGDAATGAVSPEEFQLADAILNFGAAPAPVPPAPPAPREGAAPGTPPIPPAVPIPDDMDKASAGVAPLKTQIRIHVFSGGIEQLALTSVPDPVLIDCMAVGHYLRVKPTGAERDLDRAIYYSLAGAVPPLAPPAPQGAQPGDNADEVDENLLLAQLYDRGIVRGELGAQFYLPDPRPGFAGNLLAMVGMGPAGGFGVPELTYIVRDLAWALGQLGKKHLATVLIGAGKKNLSIPDTIHGWLLGLNRALASAAGTPGKSLESVTFVVFPSTNLNTSSKSANSLSVVVSALANEAKLMQSASLFNFDIQLLDMPPIPPTPPTATFSSAVTRIYIDFENGLCRYSAVTEGAAVPERVFKINPKRITDINARLLVTDDPMQKYKIGQFLLDYLFPSDLRQTLFGSAAIVLTCNQEAAQVYWELAAQPSGDDELVGAADLPYLGLARGLTRQLKTVLAPPSDSTPPASRLLRVLLVADTCKEHPLPGAREEADSLQKLIASINASRPTNHILLTTLIGPSKANTLDVLLGINSYPPFDVLHYAGHCVYDKDDPENSGLLFSDGDRLTAKDLNRIDRTPRLVFANACESGVLPSRRDLSSPALPATFAQAFFQKGVANFICTAWPIGDVPARDFALEFYRHLLGDGTPPAPMYQAIRKARQKIASTQTWGAYQHYGSPSSRVFRAR